MGKFDGAGATLLFISYCPAFGNENPASSSKNLLKMWKKFLGKTCWKPAVYVRTVRSAEVCLGFSRDFKVNLK
jgi:hypothetical protein